MPSWQNYVKRYNDDSENYSPDCQGDRGTMTIINRATLTIFCPWALQGIQEAVQSASWPQ